MKHHHLMVARHKEVEDRRKDDPGRQKGLKATWANPYVDAPKRDTEQYQTVGPWLEDEMGTESGLPLMDFLIRAQKAPRPPVVFPPDSPLGKLQRAMLAERLANSGKYPDNPYRNTPYG